MSSSVSDSKILVGICHVNLVLLLNTISKDAEGILDFLGKFHNYNGGKLIRNNFIEHQERYKEITSGDIY